VSFGPLLPIDILLFLQPPQLVAKELLSRNLFLGDCRFPALSEVLFGLFYSISRSPKTSLLQV
jgi:hypothetical protein